MVQEEQLSCVFQQSAKQRCRFVQEMHESPNCARDTGQGEKGQPGARARECSRVQEEEGVDAGAAQGRVGYDMGRDRRC